jgi:hypothetical protein
MNRNGRKQLMRACLVVLVLVAAPVFPFIPIGYDPLARPLAGIAWFFGRVGLLLVPIGGLWLWAAAWPPLVTGPPRWLVAVTLGTIALISLVMTLLAYASSNSLWLAAGAAVTVGLLSVRLRRWLRAAPPSPAVSRMAAAFLTIAPIVVLATQLLLVDPVTSYGRNRVIANSAPLIAEIERYHARHGVYPVSLFSLYGDYKPAIMGVERYYYEPSGDAYNVIFEEPSLGVGRRFVVYNPHDKQRLTVHETDRLLLDEAGLDADNAGYTIVEPLPQPHWKLFTFRS